MGLETLGETVRTDGQDPADSIAASYTVDMADQVDRLEDVVKERLMELRRQNPGVDEVSTEKRVPHMFITSCDNS